VGQPPQAAQPTDPMVGCASLRDADPPYGYFMHPEEQSSGVNRFPSPPAWEDSTRFVGKT
jgi:hypothetical protein